MTSLPEALVTVRFEDLSSRAHGERVRVPSNRRILLNDPEHAWVVRDGGIDVFAVKLRAGEPFGAWRYLLSLDRGSSFCGLPEPAADGVALIGVTRESTELAIMSMAQLRENCLEDGGVATVIVEGFIAAASHVIAQSDPRQIDTFLFPGAAPVHLAPGRRAGPRRDVIWIRAVQGQITYQTYGVEVRGAYVPRASGTWVDGAKGLVVEGVETFEYFEAERDWSSLDTFRRVFAGWIAAEVAAREQAEADRIRERTAAAERQRRAALFELLSLSRKRVPVRSEAASGDALLAACRAIGRVARIEFVSPPDWELRRGRVDPVAAICHASGVRSRTIALRGEWWTQSREPILAYRQRAPVALLPAGRKGYTLFDPADGMSVPVTPEVANELDNFGQVFYRPLPDRKLGLGDLFRFAAEEMRLDLGLVGLLAGASALLGLLLPTATKFVFRTVVPSVDGGQLALVFVGLLVANLGAAAFDLTRAFVILRMNGKTAITMEAALFDRMLKLPTTFFRRYTIGDLVSRMNGIGTVRTLLSGTAVATILGLITGAFNFLLMFWYDWKLALVATGFALLSAAFLAACTWATVRHEKTIQELSGRISGLVVQMLAGIAKLRVAGAEERALATWSRVYAQNVRARSQSARVQAVVAVFNDALPLMNSLVIFGGVGWIAAQEWGRIDTASFMAFNTAMGIFLSNAIATANTVVNSAQVVPHLQRAKPILVTEPEVPQGKPNPGELSGEIEAKHLSFRYHPEGLLILDDVSFYASTGEFIALVGPSGSGKSTTLRLLLGFETPETGAIYFDGKDLADVDVSAVRRQMGVVLQTSRVMAGSIFKNIVGSAPLTEADAWEAAEMAGLADDIRAMPMGMHTVVSEGGSTLSGGQRQRLLIARALVRKPRIILFDEATSALDNQTQQIVSDSLDRIHATRFVIAHRLSTVRNADRIYVLDRGRIVESGSYDELMATQGMFARLAARQLA